MQLVALFLSIFLLILETTYCRKTGRISIFLVVFLFNFIFMHSWILLSWYGLDWEIGDTRVSFCLAVNDVVWIILRFLEKKKKLTLSDAHAFSVKKHEIKAAYALLIISYVVGLYYISSVGVSIFADDVEFARFTAKKGHGYLNMFITRGLLLGTVMLFVLYKLKKIKVQTIILAVLAVCALQVATGFRSYIINTFIIIGIISTNMDRTYKLSNVLYIVVIGTVFFSGITLYKYRATLYDFSVVGILGEAWPTIHHRVVMEGPRIIQKTIFITDLYGHTYGKTYFWDLYAGLPGPGLGYGDRLFIWLDTKNSIAGLAPLAPALVGESYMNFGVVGVIIGALLSYILFYAVNNMKEATVIDVALKGMFFLLVSETVYLGMGTMVVSRIMTTIFFVLMYYGLIVVFKDNQTQRPEK